MISPSHVYNSFLSIPSSILSTLQIQIQDSSNEWHDLLTFGTDDTAQSADVNYLNLPPKLTSDDNWIYMSWLLKADAPLIALGDQNFYTTQQADNFDIRCKIPRSFEISDSQNILFKAIPIAETVAGSIATNIEYTEELADTNSEAFKTAAAKTESDLETFFKAADSVQSATATVTAFKPPSSGFRVNVGRKRRSGGLAEAEFEVQLLIDPYSETAKSGDVAGGVTDELSKVEIELDSIPAAAMQNIGDTVEEVVYIYGNTTATLDVVSNFDMETYSDSLYSSKASSFNVGGTVYSKITADMAGLPTTINWDTTECLGSVDGAQIPIFQSSGTCRNPYIAVVYSSRSEFNFMAFTVNDNKNDGILSLQCSIKLGLDSENIKNSDECIGPLIS